MQTKFISLLILAAVAGSANATNLVTNGSFEQLPAGGFNNGDWGLYSTIPGWFSSPIFVNGKLENNPIEVGLGTVYGVTGYDGNNVCELDSTANSQINQIIAAPRSTDLTLSFEYAMRAGTAPSTNTFEVLWNGHDLGSITPTSSAMTTDSINIKSLPSFVSNSLNLISFRATGTSDSYGGIIDNVAITNAVPEPASFAPLGIGALVLLRRRKTSK